MRILVSICIFICGLGFSSAHADYEAGKRAYDAGEYETAYEEWLPLAEEGDAEAQYKVGYMFSEGLGREIDLIEAQVWFLKAIRPTTWSSKFNLGYILLSLEHYEEGWCWLLLAAEHGSTKGREALDFYINNGVSELRIQNSITLVHEGKCTSLPLM